MSELEYLITLNELSWEFNAFHLRVGIHGNPFASDVEELQRLSVHVERVTDDLNASMFLDDVMSDNVSNVEQSLQIAQASQPNPSRASLDSANPEGGTAVNLSSVWPPLNTSQIASGAKFKQRTSYQLEHQRVGRKHECRHDFRECHARNEPRSGPAGFRSTGVWYW